MMGGGKKAYDLETDLCSNPHLANAPPSVSICEMGSVTSALSVGCENRMRLHGAVMGTVVCPWWTLALLAALGP